MESEVILVLPPAVLEPGGTYLERGIFSSSANFVKFFWNEERSQTGLLMEGLRL
jgi:hypothetical protein